MPTTGLLRLQALLLSVFIAPAVMAAELDDGGFCDVFAFQVENDEVVQTDRYYTGGLRAACTGGAPSWLDGLAWTEGRPDAEVERRFTVSLGQSIFTPENIDEPELIEDDHPYAGWLYLGLGLNSEVTSADGARHLDRLELQLGVVGPYSGAEQFQRRTHDVLNATDPAGWDNQLDNEPGINVFFSRQWTGAGRLDLMPGERLPNLAFDLSPVVGAALGNVHLFAGSGLTARVGSFDAHDHGHALIRPGLAGADGFSRDDGLTAYLFGGIEGRAVARNIFLDGNSFKDDGASVDKERFVAEARAGLALAYKRLRLSYTQVFRTREFDGGEPHSYGSVTLAVAL